MQLHHARQRETEQRRQLKRAADRVEEAALTQRERRESTQQRFTKVPVGRGELGVGYTQGNGAKRHSRARVRDGMISLVRAPSSASQKKD